MSHEISYSTDVTLALKDVQSSQLVCKFHKFGQKCRHMHIVTICTNLECNRKLCLGRHPRPCKFFLNSEFCKFGADCSNIHHQSSPSHFQIEIDGLKVSLQNILQDLAKKENTIQKLQEKVDNLERRSSVQSQFNCDECGHIFKSKANLTTRIAKYHKKEAVTQADSEHTVKAPFTEQDVDPIEETPEIPAGNFEICFFCGKTFSNVTLNLTYLKTTVKKFPNKDVQLLTARTLQTITSKPSNFPTKIHTKKFHL